MQDRDKTQSQLANELAELRQKVAELTAFEARCQQLEEALRASEARYQRIIQAMTDYIYSVRVENGRAVETRHGPGCVAVTGYTSEEYEADPYLWLCMVAERDRPAVEDQARRVLAGEEASPLEHRIMRQDGVERWVRNTPVLHRDDGGKLLAYDGVVQDITERKRAEEALRIKNDAIESSINTMAFSDLEGNLTYVNAAFLRLWGYSDEKEVLGKSALDFWQSKGDAAAVVAALRVKGSWMGEMVAKRRDASTFDAQLSANILIGEAHTPVGMMATFVDVTERKWAEAALRQYTTELEVRNEELDAFAHTAAHDLKNPLSLIIGLAELLELDYASLSAAEVGHYLHRLAQHALKMNNIIDELLLLAQVRQAEVKLEPLEMASIVTGALQRLTDITEAHQAEIMLPPAWPEALGYAPWIEEVWVNYLCNAIKYGGRPPRVELGAETQGDGKARFWVHDHGPGITVQDQARLFTPFTRLDQVRAEGYGLGLSIVRRIVEKLGGQVGVESQTGCGCTFYFTLPQSRVSRNPHE